MKSITNDQICTINRLGFNSSNVVYENRGAQRVDLRRSGNADTSSGIYRCTIETNAVHSDDNTDTTTRETVYVRLYESGGDHSIIIIHSDKYCTLEESLLVIYNNAML